MKFIKDILLLIIGNILSAIAIGMIALAQGISVGGTSGLAKVLCTFIPLPLNVILWGINILLFLLALICIGKDFALKTIVSSIIFPLLLGIAMNIHVLDVLSADPLLSSILGGILLGTGGGLILRGNGSSGGFDILAVIANKYWSIKTSMVIAICDTCVLLFQINTKNILYSVYGIVMIIVTSMMINKIITKENNEVKMMVFSKKEKEIQNILLIQEDCGLSILKAETGYTNKTMDVIISIMPYEKIQSCKKAILTCDPEAFIVLENVQAAYTGNYGLRKPQDYITQKDVG